MDARVCTLLRSVVGTADGTLLRLHAFTSSKRITPSSATTAVLPRTGDDEGTDVVTVVSDPRSGPSDRAPLSSRWADPAAGVRSGSSASPTPSATASPVRHDVDGGMLSTGRPMPRGAGGVAVYESLPLALAYDTLVNALPRGISQGCFMDNPWTGVICIVASALVLPPVCTLLLLVGLLSSTLLGLAALLPPRTLATAHDAAYIQDLLARPDYQAYQHGIFGFNGMLIGGAVATFTASDTPAQVGAHICLAALGGAFCTMFSRMIRHLLLAKEVPGFSVPANLTAFMLFLAIAVAHPPAGTAATEPATHRVFNLAGLPTPPWLSGVGNATAEEAVPSWYPCFGGTIGEADTGACAVEVITAIVRGVGQTFYTDDWRAGVAVVAALLLCSPIGAVSAFVGSGFGVAVAVALGIPPPAIRAGLFGFNGALAGICIDGVFFRFCGPTVAVASLAAVFATVLQAGMSTWLATVGLPVLSLPFCATAMLFTAAGAAWTTRIRIADASTAENHMSCKCRPCNGSQVTPSSPYHASES